MTISAAEQSAIDSFMASLNAAQAYYKANEWDSAVEAFKATGNNGATALGPVIDQATSGQYASLTQKAWSLNGQLATINSGPYNGTAATKADADKAFALMQQIYGAYHDALYPAATVKPGSYVPSGVAAAVAKVTGSATTGTASSTSTSWLPLIGGALIGGAIGNVFGLAAAVVGVIVGAVAGNSVSKKGTA